MPTSFSLVAVLIVLIAVGVVAFLIHEMDEIRIFRVAIHVALGTVVAMLLIGLVAWAYFKGWLN